MPQAPTSNLIEITKRVVKVAEKCCHLDGNHQVSCALENVSIVSAIYSGLLLSIPFPPLATHHNKKSLDVLSGRKDCVGFQS